MRRRTAGTWDPGDGPRYFLAHGGPTLVRVAEGPYAWDHLVAVNVIGKNGDKDRAALERLFDHRCNVLIDSGVFNLANAVALGQGIPIERVLTMPPENLAGFDALLNTYRRIVGRYGPRSWGYIEIDQGGTDAKRRTRARLEAEGFAPIPVFHPLSDGWAYFDELCEGYDRVAFANLVQAGPGDRKRLMATLWERRQRHPGVWVHALGLTPSTLTLAYPVDSADSSSWVGATRWGSFHAWAAGQRLWDTGRGWLYDQQPEEYVEDRGAKAGQVLGAYDAALFGVVLRRMERDWREALGAEPWPSTHEGRPEGRPW